jgi:hypothetical protein
MTEAEEFGAQVYVSGYVFVCTAAAAAISVLYLNAK